MRNRKAIALFAVLAIFAAACGGGTAEEVVETVIQDVINYMADEEERDDDITLVAVRVT